MDPLTISLVLLALSGPVPSDDPSPDASAPALDEYIEELRADGFYAVEPGSLFTIRYESGNELRIPLNTAVVQRVADEHFLLFSGAYDFPMTPDFVVHEAVLFYDLHVRLPTDTASGSDDRIDGVLQIGDMFTLCFLSGHLTHGSVKLARADTRTTVTAKLDFTLRECRRTDPGTKITITLDSVAVNATVSIGRVLDEPVLAAFPQLVSWKEAIELVKPVPSPGK